MHWMFMAFFLMAGAAASVEDYDQVPIMFTLAIICLLMETFGAPVDNMPTETGVQPPEAGIQLEQERTEPQEPVSQLGAAEQAEGNPDTHEHNNEPELAGEQDQATTAVVPARNGEAAVEIQASADQEQAEVAHQASADHEQAEVTHQASVDHEQPEVPYGVQETNPERSLNEYFARLLGVDRILSTAANDGPTTDTDPVSVRGSHSTGNHSLGSVLPDCNLWTSCGIPTVGLPASNVAKSVGTQTLDQPLMMSEGTSASQTPNTNSEIPTASVKTLPKKDYKKLKDRLNTAEGIVLCRVCQVEPRTMLFCPCRHFAVCCTCSEKIRIENGLCCICRCPIQEYLPIYCS